MRKLLAGVLTSAFIMIGCTSVMAASSSYTNETRSNLPTSFFPQEIEFVTRDQGYVSGTLPFHGSTVAQLYKTINGGSTWTLVYSGGVSISSLAAFGQHVWIDVAKTSSYPVKGELFSSSTGGKYFNTISSRTLSNMAFTSGDVGFGVATSAYGTRTLVITIDGGSVWKPVKNVPTPVNEALGQPQSLGFADARNGLLLETGEPSAGQEPKVLLRTTNGGQSWVTISKSNSENGVHSLGSGGYTNGIAVSPEAPDDAWIWQTYGLLLHTTDGGTDWTRVDISRLDLQSGMDEVMCMSFISPSTGYALLHHNYPGGTSTLIETQNSGKTWSVVRKW